MPQLETTAIVPLDLEAAFALAHTTGDERACWDPQVAVSRWIRGASGPAAEAHLFTKSPRGRRRILRFDVVHPATQSSCRLVKGDPLFADYGEGLRFVPVDEGTRVTWKVIYKVASPLAARAIGELGLPLVERELEARLAGFRRRAEELAER